jgi:hypothetical protein
MNTQKQHLKTVKDSPHDEALNHMLQGIREDFEKKNLKLDTADTLFDHLLDQPSSLATDLYELAIKSITGSGQSAFGEVLLSHDDLMQIDRIACLAKYLSEL